MNNAPVQDDVVLHEDLPEVTKFEYQVQWSDLVQRNGLDKLLGVFDVPDPLAKSQAVEGRNRTVTASFEGDGTLITQQDLSLQGHITGDGLSQVIASGFRRVFAEIAQVIRPKDSGEVLAPSEMVFGAGVERTPHPVKLIPWKSSRSLKE